MLFMTSWLDNIDIRGLIENLFAPFLTITTSSHFFILCLCSQVEHSLPFMHRLIQHLDLVFTRRSSLSHHGTSLIVSHSLLIFSRLSASVGLVPTRSFSSLSP